MATESRLKYSIFVLLEGRSYDHLFNSQIHTKKTLPIITTLHEQYASIPNLNLENSEDDTYQTLQNIFGPQAKLLSEIDSKIYGYIPSVMKLLNSKAKLCAFDQFFNDIENKKLPLLSVIESNTYLDGEGWSMCVDGNNLNYAEHKLFDIYQAVTNSTYNSKAHIIFLWVDTEDTKGKTKLANIWVSPYMTHGKRIFDRQNRQFTTKSLQDFLLMLYTGSTSGTEVVKNRGSLWQKNLLTEKPSLVHSKLKTIVPNEIEYNMGSSPFKLGHAHRIPGSAERIYQRANRDVKNLEETYTRESQNMYSIQPFGAEEDATTGFWLTFAAVILWFFLVFGLFYVYIKKYKKNQLRYSSASSFTLE